MDVRILILEILKKEKRPMTATEVRKELEKRGYKFTYAWIKNRLDELTSDGKIIKYRMGRTDSYMVEEVASQIVTLDRFISYTTTDNIELQRLKETVEADELKVFESALDSWLSIIRVWEDILEPKLRKNSNVLKFASLDPRKISLELFDFLVQYTSKLNENFVKCTDPRERTKIRQKIEYLEKKVLPKLASYLGIPHAPKGVIFSIEREKTEEIPVIKICDRSLLEALIDGNILGKQIIERIVPERLDRDPAISVGVDGTRFEIHASYILNKVAHYSNLIGAAPPIYINAAVSSWLEVGREEGPIVCDPRPLPEDWAEYEQSRAVREGLILTPAELSEYSESIWKRAAEAAMNAIEYRKLKEAFAPPEDVLGRGVQLPCFAFLDGRIYPYEHKFDDYIHDHHEQVSLAFEKLNELIALNNTYNPPEDPKVLLCGLVKRSELNVFRFLLAFWMLREKIIKEDEFWKVLRSHIPDGYLIWKLFSLIEEFDPGKEGILITFRVRKPFFSIVLDKPLKDVLNEGKTVDEKLEALMSQTIWERHLRNYAEEKNRPMISVSHYAVTCAKGYILHFYSDAPHLRTFNEIILPRFEILVPYGASTGEQLKIFDRTATSRLSSLLYHYRNWLVFYKLYLRDVVTQTQLLVTREVNSAHEYANKLGRTYSLTVIGLLEKALINLLTKKYAS